MAGQHQPSRLLTLPPEIKNIIYRYLLPDDCSSVYLSSSCKDRVPQSLYVSKYPVDTLEPNVATCMKMARVCGAIRCDILPLTLSRLKFHFNYIPGIELFNKNATGDFKKLMRALEMNQHFFETVKTDIDRRNAYASALAGFTGVQHLDIVSFKPVRDAQAKGTGFFEKDLRSLKAIMAELSQLSKACWEFGPEHNNYYRNIRLQTPDLPLMPNATEFSPNEEYKKYLTKQREKTATRKEAKKAAEWAAAIAATATATAAACAELREKMTRYSQNQEQSSPVNSFL